MGDVPGRAVKAALVAHTAYQTGARQAVWTSPPEEQVRAMLEAAAPFIAAAEREKAAREIEGLGVPGVERRAYEDAARIVREGGAG